MDDDDEFGDLYADVLLPIPRPSASIPPPVPLFNDDDEEDDDLILYGAPRSTPSPAPKPPQTLDPTPSDDAEDDWLLGRPPATVDRPDNWDDGDEGDADADASRKPAVPDPDLRGAGEPRVLDEEEGEEARASDAAEAEGLKITEEDGGGGGDAEKTEIGDQFEEPIIPGLSAGPPAPGPLDARASDWDSDSEDDLQIVLNESNPVPPFGGERNERLGEDDDDEDGEEDLVIVADDQQPIHRPGTEEQDWGEESLQPTADGERKEMSDAGKVNSAVGNAAAMRIGYSNHGFHPQHHSMFKYIRPGAGPVPGGPVVGALGGPGQIRPPPTFGPTAGRGRGDWRPPGGRSGYGLPGWANNMSGRAFGSGLDFTLPSHKTAFDIDIEIFDEKPWRYTGVDISDFFNFGLDEDNWKAYCKQLEQLRLEATMQSKIRVYEGGRPEQDYDPDLPPELAAAAGHHDSSDMVHHGKTDSGQADLNGLGRGAGGIRAPLPIGRAIQVEAGFGERLPSIDTRPPRFRDSDAIIEIVLQVAPDDSEMSNGVQLEKELQGDKAAHVFEEDDRDAESEQHDRFPHSFNARRRERVTRKGPSVPEDDILPIPSDSPVQDPYSKMRSPVNTGGPSVTHHGGRWSKGTSRGRQPTMSGEHSGDTNSVRNSQLNRHEGHQIEQPKDSIEDNQTSEASPGRAVSATRELSLEQRDSEHDDRLALGDSNEVGEDIVSDFRISSETAGDDSLDHSSKKQKLSSRVEQPAVQDNGDDDDIRGTHSDNSRAKSGNSKDYKKRREGGEEVIQDGRSRRMGDSRRRHEEEDRSFRRKDDYSRDGRHEIDRNRAASKGRDAPYHSYPHKDRDSSSAHHVRGRSEAFERQKEIDGRQRRDDDIHSRRVKDEDARRERNEETGSKTRSIVKVGDRNGKGDDIHLKKRVDDGDLRGRHREGGPRQRDDMLMRRRENLDEPPTKRKKDEEHSRREKADKEDTLHGHRAREDSNRRKTDDSADHKRREDDTRTRGETEDRHSAKPRDDSWRQREREDRQRPKQSHKEPQTHREREEGRTSTRNGRAVEDKLLAGNGKNKDDSKALGSDKDNQHKDRRRQNEQFKRVDRAGERSNSQHKGHEDVNAREKRTNEERSPRHERLTGRHSDRPSNASDSKPVHGERQRENTRKIKDIEVGEQNSQGLDRKKHEEDDTHQNEKVSRKNSSEHAHKHIDEQQGIPKPRNPSRKFGEDDPGSDDENQKGRSKLERWTSHKERDYSIVGNNLLLPSSSRTVESTESEMIQADESVKTLEGNNANDSESKGVDAGQTDDKTGEDLDPHNDTVAKLKRRSERFKLAMPGDKDTVSNKKAESEAQLTPSDTAAAAADSEIKTERPARKRRWTGS